MSKYYKPGIEEFNVDFEFEAKIPPYEYREAKRSTIDWTIRRPIEWQKCRFIWEMVGMMPLPFHLPSLMSEDRVRVKYLDREDIESFGYHTEDNGECYNKTEGFDIYGIYPWFGDNEYKIVKNTKTIFHGILLNRSELKRELIKLNIYKYE